MKITPKEMMLLRVISQKENLKITSIENNPDPNRKQYDLHLKGESTLCPFNAWLPLFAIRNLTNWTSKDIAICSNHPQMVMEGDWSGIRDSQPENIWSIFYQFVERPLLDTNFTTEEALKLLN